MPLERDTEILCALVDVYVREGRPVSSLRLKKSAGMAVSTATIRNGMARLEREGYLVKPHASAGRVPTDAGYRRYVDGLEADPRWGDTFSSRFRGELGDRAPDTVTIMACASRVLAALSRNLAVVYGSVVQESRVVRVRLLNLEGTRLLVVVNLDPEYERTSVLRMERRFDADVVGRAETRINRAVRGQTLREAQDSLDATIRDNITDEGIIARELAVHREEIFSDPPAVELYFEEREPLMAQPELSDPRLLRLLLRLLHSKDYLTQLLSSRVGEKARVTIGHEHGVRELEPFSLVTAGYQLGAARGVLGIIGPTRMRYDLTQALVVTAARELQAIGEELL